MKIDRANGRTHGALFYGDSANPGDSSQFLAAFRMGFNGYDAGSEFSEQAGAVPNVRTYIKDKIASANELTKESAHSRARAGGCWVRTRC